MKIRMAALSIALLVAASAMGQGAMAGAHDMAERTEVQDFLNALGAEGK